jgi:hypothetical protein
MAQAPTKSRTRRRTLRATAQQILNCLGGSPAGQKGLKQLQGVKPPKASLLSRLKGLCAQCGLVYVSLAAILGAATLVPSKQAVQEEPQPHHCQRSRSQAVNIDLSLGATEPGQIQQMILSFQAKKGEKLDWAKLQNELNEATHPSSSKMDEEKDEWAMEEETATEGSHTSPSSTLPGLTLIETLGELPVVLVQLQQAVDTQTAQQLAKKLTQFRTPDDTKGLLCSHLQAVEINRKLIVARTQHDWTLPPESHPTYFGPFRGDRAYSIYEGMNFHRHLYRYLEIPQANNGYPWFAKAFNQYEGLTDAQAHGVYAFTGRIPLKLTSASYQFENSGSITGTGGVIEGWRLMTSGQDSSPNRGLGDVGVTVIDGPLPRRALEEGYVHIENGYALLNSGITGEQGAAIRWQLEQLPIKIEEGLALLEQIPIPVVETPQNDASGRGPVLGQRRICQRTTGCISKTGGPQPGGDRLDWGSQWFDWHLWVQLDRPRARNRALPSPEAPGHRPHAMGFGGWHLLCVGGNPATAMERHA